MPSTSSALHGQCTHSSALSPCAPQVLSDVPAERAKVQRQATLRQSAKPVRGDLEGTWPGTLSLTPHRLAHDSPFCLLFSPATCTDGLGDGRRQRHVHERASAGAVGRRRRGRMAAFAGPGSPRARLCGGSRGSWARAVGIASAQFCTRVFVSLVLHTGGGRRALPQLAVAGGDDRHGTLPPPPAAAAAGLQWPRRLTTAARAPLCPICRRACPRDARGPFEACGTSF